jgi:pimeloyl-ACP methyl ester carboxylesterase
MLRRVRLSGVVLSVLWAVPSGAAEPPAWPDPSPHTVRFVAMADGVRLEVLDWGGSGRAIVLLAGGGNTAHVFDDFAPRLTADYRVYGITRRGFGASGFADSPNPVDRLRTDLLAALDALHLDRPVLVGHSIAGAEMSALANSHPSRIAGLVYVDAAYPYAFDDGSGRTILDFEPPEAVRRPSPGPSGRESFHALRTWSEGIDGFRTPEAEFRQLWKPDAKGTTLTMGQFPGGRVFSTIMMNGPKYATVPVPTLAIFALPHSPGKSTDPTLQKAVQDYFTRIDALTEKQAVSFAKLVRGSRVVRVPGSHHLFLSNAPEVLREVRAFIDGLR